MSTTPFPITQKLFGKIALITGGTSGLGFATARRFVAEGAFVFITGRRQQELAAAVEELGTNALGIRSDSMVAADRENLFAKIKQQKGRLDILFANAGVAEFVDLEHITEAQFDNCFDINVKGTLFTVQQALSLIPPGGAIVLNGSMVSVKGAPALGVYAATKAAIRSLARTWAIEFKRRNVRVNVIAPGTVVTPGYKKVLGLTDEEIEEITTRVATNTPSGRTGTPDEIATAVLFLASEDSSYVNGIELFVDGGAAQI